MCRAQMYLAVIWYNVSACCFLVPCKDDWLSAAAARALLYDLMSHIQGMILGMPSRVNIHVPFTSVINMLLHKCAEHSQTLAL